jgi:hypothetical protein
MISVSFSEKDEQGVEPLLFNFYPLSNPQGLPLS